jgi:hypothetical protein
MRNAREAVLRGKSPEGSPCEVPGATIYLDTLDREFL